MSEPASRKALQRRPGALQPSHREDRPTPKGGRPKGRLARRSHRRKRWSEAEVQAGLLEMAGRLETYRGLVKSMHAGLAPPAEGEARREHLEPYNVTVELLGGLENLHLTAIPGLVKELRGLARVTNSKLQRNFERLQGGRPREEVVVGAELHRAAIHLVGSFLPLALSVVTRVAARTGGRDPVGPRKELPARAPSAARRGGGKEGT